MLNHNLEQELGAEKLASLHREAEAAGWSKDQKESKTPKVLKQKMVMALARIGLF